MNMANSQEKIPMHDPCIIQQDSTFHIFATGKGIAHWISTDLKNWRKQSPIFDTLPWAVETINGFKNHIWAPDIAFYNNTYYLFYSISTFGKNNSCIGVATNTTLDTKAVAYKWKDAGKIICSTPGKDNFNAIDANFITDEFGKPWLSFGSFWGGIQIVPLQENALQTKNATQPITIAKRTRTINGNTAIEAPFIYQKNGWYYLFVSADLCCKGAESTYKIMVGRSKNITGPYVDKSGTSMLDGGGSLVQQGDGKKWFAVGHNAVAKLNGIEYLVYHGYDVADNGKSKLVMVPLFWDEQYWPFIKSN